MVKSSAFTKRYSSALPMEMYNTLDRLADLPDYASINHATRRMIREGFKRSRVAWRIYNEECDKFDLPKHMR